MIEEILFERWFQRDLNAADARKLAEMLRNDPVIRKKFARYSATWYDLALTSHGANLLRGIRHEAPTGVVPSVSPGAVQNEQKPASKEAPAPSESGPSLNHIIVGAFVAVALIVMWFGIRKAPERPMSDRILGTEGREMVLDLAPARENGWWFAGMTNSETNPMRAWVGQMDQQGKLNWHYAVGTPALDGATAIRALPNGDAVVAGSTTSPEDGRTRMWLARFNNLGAPTWQVSLGGGGFDEVDDLTVLPNGNIVAVGITLIDVRPNDDVLEVRGRSLAFNGYVAVVAACFSPAGKLLWQSAFDASHDPGIAGGSPPRPSVAAFPDNSCIIAAISDREPPHHGHGWVLHLADDGQLKQQAFLTSDRPTTLEAVHVDDAGAVWLAGNIIDPKAPQHVDAWAARLTPALDHLWSIQWRDEAAQTAADFTRSGRDRVTVAGTRKGEAWISQITDAGTIVWQSTYVAAGPTTVTALTSSDQRYILGGQIGMEGNREGWWLAVNRDSTSPQKRPAIVVTPTPLELTISPADGDVVECNFNVEAVSLQLEAISMDERVTPLRKR